MLDALPFANTVLLWGGVAAAMATVCAVLQSNKVSQAKVAWILGAVAFPWMGSLAYLCFGRRRMQRKVIRIRRARGKAFEPLDERWEKHAIVPEHHGRTSLSREISLGAERVDSLPPVDANRVELFTDGPEAFAAWRSAIRKAEHHVHLLSYVFKNDDTGKGTVDLLVEAAERGVEVRVLVDGIGCLEVSTDLFLPLRRAGGKVETFLPVSRWRSGLRLNLRNHRKLMVIDGCTALSGGMNIGDEYALEGAWPDVHALVEGPVVPALQRVFAEDWNFAAEELLEGDHYFFKVPPAGEVPVRVVASGPDQAQPHAEDLMFATITACRSSLEIITPYLVPTPSIEYALCSAARRGREVRILIPKQMDHRLVRWATEAYMPMLLDAGVRVWRYPKMLHAKVLIVDGEWTTVGSTNLDMRSLQLNFELNLAFPHAATAQNLREHFEEELLKSEEVGLDDLHRGAATLPHKLAHLLAPVL